MPMTLGSPCHFNLVAEPPIQCLTMVPCWQQDLHRPTCGKSIPFSVLQNTLAHQKFKLVQHDLPKFGPC